MELEQAAFLKLVRSVAEMMADLAALLRPYGLTPSQYNVLRILRGAGEEGLKCQQISDRMLNRLPDITRLVDRLEAAGHVIRERARDDRRVILVRITGSGSRLVSTLDDPVRELHRAQFSAATESELGQLLELLGRIRQN